MSEKPTSNLVLAEQFALVPSNPRVQKLASRFHWGAERAIARIQAALPTVVEQQLYLAVGPDFGILPESLAKLIRIYNGEEEIDVRDLAEHTVGKNLVYSKFQNFTEFLRECLRLLKVVSQEFTHLSLSIDQAAFLVLHYGTDNPELVIEMVENNLEEMCDFFGVNPLGAYSYKVRVCLWLMIAKIIPYNRDNGCPDILDPSDFMEIMKQRRGAVREAIAEELGDLLAEDSASVQGSEAFRKIFR